MCKQFMNKKKNRVFYFKAMPKNLGYTSKTGRMHLKKKTKNLLGAP